mgnify:CR=1 FL=1
MTSRRFYVLLLALLLGAALRFYRLDAQSFWSDEGNAARLAERSVKLIVEGAGGDIHPPGYYLLLRAWRDLTGGSEFALRAFSALCGVLTVALAAALGCRVGGPRSALGAAFALAVHPLAVYYSQEARMYALLGLLAAATLWIAARWQQSPRRDWPAAGALFLALTLGLYTHYAYGFVVLGVNAAFVAVWLGRRPREWRRLLIWAGAHLGAALAFLPWLPNALRVTGWAPPDLNSGQALSEMTRALLVGITLPAGMTTYWLTVAGLLLLLALLTRSRSPFVKWGAFAVTALPIALIAALDVYRAAYLKFLMVAVVPLAVLLALPLAPLDRKEGRGRREGALAGGVLLLALLPAQFISLRHLYVDPAYARDDYRRLAEIISAEAQPEDAVILSAPNQWEVFAYYYDGPATVYPAPYHPEVEKARAWIEEVRAAGHPRLFVLYWGERESDPHGRLERRLAQQAYKATERWVTDVRLARYRVAPLPDAPQAQTDARLGKVITLEGYSLVETPVRPGEIVPVTLFWRTAAALDERYKVFVHLLDENGVLVTQTDAEPVGGLRPTTGWAAGEAIVDRYGVLLPDDLPRGTYTLTTGMYRPADGTRLDVERAAPPGDRVVLQTLEVQ